MVCAFSRGSWNYSYNVEIWGALGTGVKFCISDHVFVNPMHSLPMHAHLHAGEDNYVRLTLNLLLVFAATR